MRVPLPGNSEFASDEWFLQLTFLARACNPPRLLPPFASCHCCCCWARDDDHHDDDFFGNFFFYCRVCSPCPLSIQGRFQPKLQCAGVRTVLFRCCAAVLDIGNAVFFLFTATWLNSQLFSYNWRFFKGVFLIICMNVWNRNRVFLDMSHARTISIPLQGRGGFENSLLFGIYRHFPFYPHEYIK